MGSLSCFALFRKDMYRNVLCSSTVDATASARASSTTESLVRDCVLLGRKGSDDSIVGTNGSDIAVACEGFGGVSIIDFYRHV